MASELGFALINPYTIAKSRTGGVIGRLISRTGLRLVAARMFGPSRELAERYAESLEKSNRDDREITAMLAGYVRRHYSPDPGTGHRRRVILLLMEGENAIQKIREATGHLTSCWLGGETIRDTYGDFILDDAGKPAYFEPAVMVSPTVERAAEVTRLWAEFTDTDGGIIDQAADVTRTEGVQSTLVLLKPENFRTATARPGHIIDLLSRSGLRIIGLRRIEMTVAQAEQFYGPVLSVLQEKFKGPSGARAGEVMAQAFGIEISEELKRLVGEHLGPVIGQRQFESIIQFMTGVRPSEVAEADKQKPGTECCLALIYKGMSAIEKIRYLLGPTDPAKAGPGSVRGEFGSDVMVNAAHASDSPENAVREMAIVNVGKDTIREWVHKYYGA